MESIGEMLKTAREAKGVSTSEAAKGTRIKVQHIEAMERDDFDVIPAVAYAKGFIKIYAEYLGLDPQPLVRRFMEEHAPKERPPLVPEETRRGDPGATAAKALENMRKWLQSFGPARRRRAGYGVALGVVGGVLLVVVAVRCLREDNPAPGEGGAAVVAEGVSGEIVAEPPLPYLPVETDAGR